MPFRRIHRLRAKRDIDAVLKEGHKITAKHLVIRVRRASTSTGRVAIIVPRSLGLTAAHRNLMRRRLSAMLRTYHIEQRALDIVVLPLKSIVGKGVGEIKSDIEQTIKKLPV